MNHKKCLHFLAGTIHISRKILKVYDLICIQNLRNIPDDLVGYPSVCLFLDRDLSGKCN